MRKHLNDNEKIEFKYLLELVSSSVNGTAPPIPYAVSYTHLTLPTTSRV